MAFEQVFTGNTDKTITLGLEGNPTSIEGYFLGTKTTPDKGYGPGKLHIFQTEEGTVGVWGKTRLNSALTEDLRGMMVRASFTGMIAPKTKGRRPSYGFMVERDKNNTIDVSGVNLDASSDAEEESSDEGSYQEPAPTYTSKPSAPAKVAAASPSADRQARVQALLSGKKTA